MAATAILGANGVYGRHLTPRLIAAGHSVRALVRRPEAAGAARGCGADVRVADIFDEDSMAAAMEGCEISINLATSLPGPSGRGDYAVNDRVRREGAPNWLKACERAGVKRVIQQSIAMVNATGETMANEGTLLGPVENPLSATAIQASIDMEAVVRASNLDWIILRGGLFYGPGTGFDDDWFARAATGKLRTPGDGGEFVSLVHTTDMAAATVKAVERWPSRQALIIADDAPVRWRDLFGYIAELAGAAPPATGGRAGFPSFRVSNALARETLGWTPHYADYRAGLIR
jgi:nucleoside-diphosphate-sugar epimerase